MSPTKWFLSACLIALVASVAVGTSVKEKPIHLRLLTHHSSRPKHEPTSASSDVGPPLEQDAVQHKKEPPILSDKVKPHTSHLKTVPHRPKQKETISSTTSLITESLILPQKQVTHIVTPTKPHPRPTSKRTDIPSSEQPPVTTKPTIFSNNVSTVQKPQVFQLKLTMNISLISASKNDQPNNLNITGENNTQKSKAVASDVNLILEPAASALLTANIETSGDSNVHMKQTGTRLFYISVKPQESSESSNKTRGPRPHKGIDEDRTLSLSPDVNPFYENMSIDEILPSTPELSQSIPTQPSMNDETTQIRESMEMAGNQNHANSRQNTHDSGTHWTAEDNQSKAGDTERQFISDETISGQGDVRRESLEKNWNTRRNKMVPAPKRNSGNTHVEGRIDGQRKPIVGERNRQTLRKRNETRTFSKPRPTLDSTKHEMRVAEHKGNGSLSTEGSLKPIRERGDNRRGRTHLRRKPADPSDKEPEVRLAEHKFKGNGSASTEGSLKVEPTKERGANRRERTNSRRRPALRNNEHDVPVAEHKFESNGSTSVEGSLIVEPVRERVDNGRNSTLKGPTRISGHRQIKPRVAEKEMEAGDVTLDQDNMKVETSEMRVNRRSSPRLHGRNRTLDNKEGEGEKRDIGKRSVNNGTRNFGLPPMSDPVGPGSRSVKSEDEDNGRKHRPSLGHGRMSAHEYPAHSPETNGSARVSGRRSPRTKQAYLGDATRDQGSSRKKRSADGDCAQGRPAEKKGGQDIWQEILKTKCDKCFEVKDCGERVLITCKGADTILISVDGDKCELDFGYVNLYASIVLCELIGMWMYLYVNQRLKKQPNTSLCMGLLIMCILNIVAILATN